MLSEFGNGGIGYELRFSADGSRLIGSGLVGKTGYQRLSLWDVATGMMLRELSVDTPLTDEHWDRNSIRPQFAKSGPMLVIEVINDTKRSLRVWNTASNEQTLVVNIDRFYPVHWVLSTNGKYLIVREESGDENGVQRHRVFEIKSGDNIKHWTPVSLQNE